MKPGRNDPCPCGSGMKYKKCCLDKETARPQLDAAAELRESAMKAILRYAKRPEFEGVFLEAQELFEKGRLDSRSADERSRVKDADWNAKFAFFLLFDFPFEPDGRTLGRRFLAEEGRRLADPERELLERFSASSLRPYEVQDVQLDSGLRLLDLWSETEVLVSERMATHQLQRWDVLGARVVAEGERHLFEGGLYLFRADHKPALMELIRNERAHLKKMAPKIDDDLFFKLIGGTLFHLFWLDSVVFPPMPKIVTAEGDPMMFVKVAFDVLDREKLVAALNQHPQLEAEEERDRWSWGEQAEGFRRGLGNLALQGDRLMLEVTSRERAQRGRQLLEEAAGESLRHRITGFEPIEQALKRPRPPREASLDIPPEVAAEVIRQYKDTHYRTWPDEPLPALDGRTPRHAAKLKTVRPKLVDLLKAMENSEARSASPHSPAYDFGWIWTELGLESP